jgi:PknH-like extracellular domain
MRIAAPGLARTIAVLGLAVALVTGCTVEGKAAPALNLKPRPLTGETIKRVLLDDAALERILDQPFRADVDLQPWFGGPDQLRHAFGSVTPGECAGVTTVAEESAYKSTDMRAVAGETWSSWGATVKVINVAEGVIALPTVADAHALFGKLTEQWRRCDGAKVTLRGPRLTFFDAISAVRVANSVLAATVSMTSDQPGTTGPPLPEARAIGVRVNCLVEVKIAFYSTRRPSDRGSGDVDTSAIDIAHIMMDKISALS